MTTTVPPAIANWETVVWGGFSVLFGVAVGSFVNVVVHRLPDHGLRSLSGRSHCPRCGATIRWFDNIPVASWLVLGRRCRDCRAPISARYPTVELLTGLLFFLAWWSSAGTADPLDRGYSARLIVNWVLLSALLALSLIDLELRILPDELTIPLMIAGPIVSGLLPAYLLDTWSSRTLEPVLPHDNVRAVAVSLLGMAVGAGVIAAVRAAGTAFFTSVREFHFTRGGGDPDRLDAFLAHQKPRHGKRVVKTWIDEGLVQLVRAGGRPELTSNPAERLHDGDRVRVRFEVEAMGFGDVKLQGGIGAFVGPEGSLLVLALASFGGAVIGSLNIARIFAILRVRSSRRRRTNANQPWRVARAAGGTVPFGPFLAGGAVVLVLARGPILTLLENMLFRRPG